MNQKRNYRPALTALSGGSLENKTFCTFNNNKCWFTAELRELHHTKEEASISGDQFLYR